MPPEYCTDSGMKHTTQFFSEGGLFAYLGASAGGAGFRFGTHLGTYGAALQEHRLWMFFWCHLSALPQLTSITQKRDYILI